MAKITEFVALENGTVSTKRMPYLFVEYGKSVHLNEEEAAFYAKSRWLRPAEEARNKPVPPIMSHTMKIIENKGKPYQLPPSAATDSYNANIAALKEREATESGSKVESAVAAQNAAAADSQIESAPAAAAQGTGNKDVLA